MSKKNIDFTFIIPNTRWHKGGKGRYWNHIPYPEAVLSEVLRSNNYNVNHIDANVENLSFEELKDQIELKAGRVVGISALSVEYKDAVHETFRAVKLARPEVKTVIGGVYPSLSPQLAREDPNIDFIIISEGEKRIVQLMKAIDINNGYEKVDGLEYRVSGEWKMNFRTDAGNIGDLDLVPFPNYKPFDTDKLFNWKQKYTQNFNFKGFPNTIMMTSRGCVYKCTYCGAGKDGNPINDGIKRLSPENVLDQIDKLVDEFGIKEIVFVDDSLLVPRDRVIAIFKGIAERRKAGVDIVWKSNNLDLRHIPRPGNVKHPGGDDDLLYWMKESGCYQISISLESGSPDTFKRMRRPTNLKHAVERLGEIRKYGFDEVCSNFIIGMPGDTWDDILKTFEFADDMINRKKLLDYALFSVATPLPNTEMMDTANEMGVLPTGFNPEEFYGFGKGVITTDEFTPEELQIARAYQWDRINFRTDRPKHHKKIAKMLGITMEELKIWRQETRRSEGVQVNAADTTDEQFDRPTALPNLFHQSTYAN